MSKRGFLMLISLIFLSACGSNSSWENEEVAVVSQRILSDDVKAEWTLTGARASGSESGEGTLIRLAIMKNNGERIEDFDITHEKLLHLMVISKDLSYFNHIHPEYKGSGVFEIRNDFPAGGEYRLIADFKPAKGGSMTKMEWVRIEGASVEPAPIIPDAQLDKIAAGVRVKLSVAPLETRKAATLKFSIADEKTDAPITDLEPYLGAIGHVVILTEDGERYIHVHADEGQGSGPEAVFETEFPRSGIYKIWGQFQRKGEVFTVPFVVEVP